jgi:hypothetical protein
MTSLLTAFLILVPAPTGDEMPTGAPPSLQYIKLVNGAFEMNVFRTEQVPFTQAIMVVNNGIVEMRNVTSFRQVTTVVRQNIDVNGAQFYSLDGKKLDDASWKKALGSGGIIAIASDGKLPHPAFRKVLREGTLIMVTKPAPQPKAPATAPMAVPAPIAPRN